MKRKMEESMSWLIRFTLVAAFIVLLAPQRTMAKGCSAHIECSVGGPASWDVIGELHVDGSCSARFPDLKCLHSCKPNVHQMKDAVKLCRERYRCADGVCVKEYDKVLGWLWWRGVYP